MLSGWTCPQEQGKPGEVVVTKRLCENLRKLNTCCWLSEFWDRRYLLARIHGEVASRAAIASFEALERLLK
jgi:hypothetical protein